MTIRSWQDVLFVIGGRQRIAYADRRGDVLDTAYHHRTGQWRAFPEKKIGDCGACHATGHGAAQTRSAAGGPVMPWAERNIGCEACHGPGGRHVDTFDFEDIVVDPSSALCGTCHTAVGRVLPADDLHETHDLVQHWNSDRHVLGVGAHSHNAFCSGCHAPYQSSVLASDEASQTRVFSEDIQNITCISCHNPHALSHPSYARPVAHLGPPLPSRRQVYQGSDRDFTTSDFEEVTTAEAVCVACHKGADRIELDHGDASCIDCHNTFWRNRSLESRIFHDANRRDLSCRPCHGDADHLMTILVRDRDFLQPKRVHDLRTLPAEVVERYGFRYPALRRSSAAQPSTARYTDEETTLPARVSPGGTPRDTPLAIALGEPAAEHMRALLAREPHRSLADDHQIRALQESLQAKPGRLAAYLELASAYGARRAHGAAWDIVRAAADNRSPWLLLDLPLDVAPLATPATESVGARLLLADLPLEADYARRWLRGTLEMTAARFSEAASIFAAARGQDPSHETWEFYSGLAALGLRDAEAARGHFQATLHLAPEHVAARVGLAVVDFRQAQVGPARMELEKAAALAPGDPVTHYLLGRAYLLQGQEERAIESLRRTVAAAPALLDAWFELARAYRTMGTAAEAIESYREIIRQKPDHAEAHFQLAKLYKRLSDNLTFQLRGDEESAPGPGVLAHDWQVYLMRLGDQAQDYRQIALEEFALALRLRPSDHEILRQIGEIHRRSGKLEEAQSIFRWLADRRPEQWVHFYRLGTIAVELGQLERAMEALRTATALAPHQGDPRLALGLAYLLGGRISEAIDSFRRAAIYEPFNPTLYTNLGAAYARRGDYGPARAALRRSLELSTFPLPRRHLTYTNLALVHLKQGRRSEAAQALKQALDAHPGYDTARRLLDALDERGETGAADLVAEIGFVVNDRLEIFGEVTTVALDNE